MAIEWKEKHYPDYAPSAKCKVYPFFGFIQDCDGDYVFWNVSRHKDEVVSGTVYIEDVPEDFDTDGSEDMEYAKTLVEAEIKKLALAHIEKLEANIAELRSALGVETTPSELVEG